MNSITADNGASSVVLEVLTYSYLHAQSYFFLWERGTNENHNRLIRRWFKGSKMRLNNKSQNWINNYPKLFNYKLKSFYRLANLNLKFGLKIIILLFQMLLYDVKNAQYFQLKSNFDII